MNPKNERRAAAPGVRGSNAGDPPERKDALGARSMHAWETRRAVDDFGNEIGPAWQLMRAEGVRLAASNLYLPSDDATNEGDNHG